MKMGKIELENGGILVGEKEGLEMEI